VAQTISQEVTMQEPRSRMHFSKLKLMMRELKLKITKQLNKNTQNVALIFKRKFPSIYRMAGP
jgi:hypothetical protein